jgi:alpha-tubulin suppressor-like RCC1 family protein
MTQVACGWHHTILVSNSNKLFTFGWSKYSQLGHGDFQDHLIPHQVKALEKTKVQSVSTFPDVLPYLSQESQNVQGFFCAKNFSIIGRSSALITSFCCIILGVCTVGKEIYILTLKAYVLSDLDHICTDIQGMVPYYGSGQ